MTCIKDSIAFQARGIDVQQVSLVINYDLPTNRENYIHRLVVSKLQLVCYTECCVLYRNQHRSSPVFPFSPCQ